MSRRESSGGSRLRRQPSEHDRRLRAEMRRERRDAFDERRFGRLRRWLGWPSVAVGLALFAVSYLGAVTGTVILPFDRHHGIGQLGGAVLAAIGLGWATGGRRVRP